MSCWKGDMRGRCECDARMVSSPCILGGQGNDDAWRGCCISGMMGVLSSIGAEGVEWSIGGIGMKPSPV